MNQPANTTEAAERGEQLLRRGQTAALLGIATCALAAVTAPEASESAAPDRAVTTAAIILAIGCMMARRFASSPVMALRARLTLALAAFSCAFGIALLGALIPWRGGASQQGIAFCLGAALLCLRRPRFGTPAAAPRSDG